MDNGSNSAYILWSQATLMKALGILLSVVVVVFVPAACINGYQSGLRDGVSQERRRLAKLAQDSQISDRETQPAEQPPIPEAQEGEISTTRFSGTGSSTTDRVYLPKGLIGAKIRASGSGNLFVTLKEDTGKTEEPSLFNEILEEGRTSEYSTSVRILRGGEFLIDVDGQGDWSLVLYKP